jgi:glycosyltransferase 2 family protein
VWLLIIFGVLLSATLLWMYFKKKSLGDIGLLLKKIWKSVVEGVSTVKHLKKRGLFLFYTVCIWLLYFAGGYIGFQALEATSIYGVPQAFSVLSAGSIGMIATPGGIGAYPFMIEKTMALYGLKEDIGVAFGWLLWLAQTGVILIGGLFSFIALPYFNKKKKHIEKTR